MEVSASKTCFSVFSKNGAGADGIDLRAGKERLGFNDTPKFLGVTFDSRLSFRPHLEQVLVRCERRLGAVRALSWASWRPRACHIRQMYLALVDSVISYAAGVWVPYLNNAGLDRLNALIYRGARSILGIPHHVNRFLAIREANLLTAELVAGRDAAFLFGRGFQRAGVDDPLRKCVENCSCTWAKLGGAFCEEQGTLAWNVDEEFFVPPDAEIDVWQMAESGQLKVIFDPASDASLESCHASSSVYYTDGSVVHSCGGAAVIAFDKSATPESDFRVVAADPLDDVADSFLAEQRAILLALMDIAASKPGHYCLFTDSLSNLLSIMAPGCRDRVEYEIMKLVCRLCRDGFHICLGFVRAHCGYSGNEAADALASVVTSCAPEGFPHPLERGIGMHLFRSWVRMACDKCGCQWLSDGDSESVQLARGMTGLRRNPVLDVSGAASLSCARADECIFNQIRCGSAFFLTGFAACSGGRVRDGRCSCGETASPLHFLNDCQRFDAQRHKAMSAFVEENHRRVQGNDLVEMANSAGIPCRLRKSAVRKWGDSDVVQHYPDIVLQMVIDSEDLIRVY